MCAVECGHHNLPCSSETPIIKKEYNQIQYKFLFISVLKKKGSPSHEVSGLPVLILVSFPLVVMVSRYDPFVSMFSHLLID